MDTARIRIEKSIIRSKWSAQEAITGLARKGLQYRLSSCSSCSFSSLKTFDNPRKGDGGAPLICNADNGEWFLHGISIYGPGCNKPGGGPSVFVKPSVFLTFIEVIKFVKKGNINF